MLNLLTGTAAAEADWEPLHAGPMHLPAIGLLQSFQFSPTIPGPYDSKLHQWNTVLTFRWVNIWAYHIESDEKFRPGMDPETFPFEFGTFAIDIEAVCMTTTLSYGLTDRADVMLSIPVYHISGGVMDGFIEGFHDAFGIDQHRRSETERDQAWIFYVDRDTNSHRFDDDAIRGYGLGDISIYTGWRLMDSSPALSLYGCVKIPTHTRMIPTEITGVDLSVMYSMAWQLGRSSIYHGLGGIYYADTGLPDIRFKRFRFTTATTVEYPIYPKIGGLLHFVANSPSAHFPQLDEHVFEMSLGVRWYRNDYILDVGFIENIFWYDNSPDFGVHIGLKRRF